MVIHDATRMTVHRYFGYMFRALVLLIALVMLLPLAYLVFRAAGVDWTEVLGLLGRTRMLSIMWNSLLLVCGVTLLSLALALPFAWLTERTDLPGRRVWTVLAMMPLVIPSYVGGFTLIAMFGPRGVLQELLSPFGVERLPSIYGFTGALWVFDALYLSLYFHEHSRRAAQVRSVARGKRPVRWDSMVYRLF